MTTRAALEKAKQALEAVMKQAKTLRNASALVGPSEYEDDPKARRVWVCTSYHNGRKFQKIAKPALAAIEAALEEKE